MNRRDTERLLRQPSVLDGVPLDDGLERTVRELAATVAQQRTAIASLVQSVEALRDQLRVKEESIALQQQIIDVQTRTIQQRETHR